MVSPNLQPLKEFRNLLCYTAKVLALFLKLFFLFIFSNVLSICLVRKCFLYLRIVDIMLIISGIAVVFYGSFTPSSTLAPDVGGRIFSPPTLDHFCPLALRSNC